MVGATPEAVESLRIALSVAAQATIALSLGLLGVSAPGLDVAGASALAERSSYAELAELFVEALRVRGVERRCLRARPATRAARGAPPPLGSVKARIAAPIDQRSPAAARRSVRLKPCAGGLPSTAGAVLGDEALLDLRLRLALGDQRRM